MQEMSDARQAIAAARGAGVSEGASQELRAAQADMARAETHLQAQEFTRARLAAREAKRQAVAALANVPPANAPHAEPSGLPNN